MKNMTKTWNVKFKKLPEFWAAAKDAFDKHRSRSTIEILLLGILRRGLYDCTTASATHRGEFCTMLSSPQETEVCHILALFM